MGLRLRLIQVDEGEVTLIAPGPGPPSCRPSRWGLTACHLGWYLRTPAQLGTNGAPTEAPPPEALCLGVLVAPARPWELGAIWAHPSVNAGLVPALLVPPPVPLAHVAGGANDGPVQLRRPAEPASAPS